VSGGGANAAVEQARRFGCDAIAWTLGEDRSSEQTALAATRQAGLAAHAWFQVARDPEAARAHPEWMHAPQHHEWLQLFPDHKHGHPAVVAPYIGLNTVAAFEHALARTVRLVQNAPWAERIWLGDIQGPPMGCGCGNPCCRSWDNAPGPKIAPTAYERPEVLFPRVFFAALSSALPGSDLVPVLCPECERFLDLEGVSDPDGPHGTDLCRGVPCVPCTQQFWPSLLAAFRASVPTVGLLLLNDALGKNHPVFGAPRAWSRLAYRHYSGLGADDAPNRAPLIACVEPADADFAGADDVLILSDAPQNAWPVAPPPGYVPTVPAIQCGYCPPSDD
jgi:hypothetical protein